MLPVTKHSANPSCFLRDGWALLGTLCWIPGNSGYSHRCQNKVWGLQLLLPVPALQAHNVDFPTPEQPLLIFVTAEEGEPQKLSGHSTYSLISFPRG